PFRQLLRVVRRIEQTALAEWEQWLDLARQFNVNNRMLTAREAHDRIHAQGRRWIGGVHSVDDGKGAPSIAAPTIANG
ncbi:D-amino-acid oxidase, partial [Rhizobium ruizarguesonis]